MLAYPAALTAQNAEDDAELFGKRPSVMSFSLSPSGRQVAYVAANGPRGQKVMLIDLNGEGAITPDSLLFDATSDQNVKVRQSRFMADRLRGAGKSVQYVEYEKLGHSLLDSAARKDMLIKIDEFLAKNLTD